MTESEPQACNFIKKETLAQVFSCEFCKISKNTFSCRTPPVAASRYSKNTFHFSITIWLFSFCKLFLQSNRSHVLQKYIFFTRKASQGSQGSFQLTFVGSQDILKMSSIQDMFWGRLQDVLENKELLAVSFPVPHWAGDNGRLPSNSSISKAVRVNIDFTRTFFKEYSTSFLMVTRLTDFVLVFLKLLMFKICEIIDISKIEFFSFSSYERVKTWKNIFLIRLKEIIIMNFDFHKLRNFWNSKKPCPLYMRNYVIFWCGSFSSFFCNFRNFVIKYMYTQGRLKLRGKLS